MARKAVKTKRKTKVVKEAPKKEFVVLKHSEINYRSPRTRVELSIELMKEDIRRLNERIYGYISRLKEKSTKNLTINDLVILNDMYETFLKLKYKILEKTSDHVTPLSEQLNAYEKRYTKYINHFVGLIEIENLGYKLKMK